MKKVPRTIALPAKDVEKTIRDLSLLVVSMDRIGSTYHDRPRQGDIEMRKYLQKVKAFRLLAGARGMLSKAYGSQSSKMDEIRLEESCEDLNYWKYKKLSED